MVVRFWVGGYGCCLLQLGRWFVWGGTGWIAWIVLLVDLAGFGVLWCWLTSVY